VYCSTSDFTHPFNPSSKVSKNAAPSTFVAAAVDDEEANATVVAATQMCFSPISLFFINTLSIYSTRGSELLVYEVTFDLSNEACFEALLFNFRV